MLSAQDSHASMFAPDKHIIVECFTHLCFAVMQFCEPDLHTSAHSEMDHESVYAAKLCLSFCLVSVSLLASLQAKN